MAEPSEGAYVLINVASQKALDVYWKNNKYQEWVMDNTRHPTWNCQTWIFDKQSDGWQITNYATWKCLDAANSSLWGRQVKDDNSSAQRWTVETDGNTATYGGTTYNTYTLKPKNRTSYSLSRDSAGWIKLVNASSNTARWILVPVATISSTDTYYIIPESDASKCIEIASGSKDNNAKAQVNSRSNKPYQTFEARVDSQNGSVKLINKNSNRALDIWQTKSTPDWVGQYTINNNSSQAVEWGQRWYILKAGTITLNGVKYPTYSLRSVRYESYGMAVVGTSIKVQTYDPSKQAQRFAFIPSAYLDNKLTVPGAFQNALFTRSGAGSVKVSGLKFTSQYSDFQMRYKVRTYSISNGKRTYQDSKWYNAISGETVNEGWGPAGQRSFTAKPSNGVVSVPDFSKSFTLGTVESCAIDLLFETHAYSSMTKNGTTFKSQSGDSKQTIKVRQHPIISVKSLSMFLSSGSDGASGDALGVRFVLSDSLNEGCSSLKGRLIGENSMPISEWVTSSNMTLDFVTGSTLYRMPSQNEKLTLSYIFVSAQDKLVTQTTISQTYSYEPSSSASVAIAKSNDGSHTVIVKTPRTKANCCFMEVKFLSGTKMIPGQFHKVDNGEIQWLCAPPLNKDVRIWVYSSNDNSGDVTLATTTVNLPSHTSIWNWGSSPKAKYTQFATLIVNPDSPPQQKRSFTTDLQFHAPAGRVLPVAFSSKALSIDLSITGVSVDKDAEYVAPTPLPPHNEVEYLILLAELAGKGIHPIYRTPYGDWYQVGISSVDVSKNAIGYSDVSINQRALED